MKPTKKRNCNSCKNLITDHVWSECRKMRGIYVQCAIQGDDGCLTCVSICNAFAPRQASNASDHRADQEISHGK